MKKLDILCLAVLVSSGGLYYNFKSKPTVSIDFKESFQVLNNNCGEHGCRAELKSSKSENPDLTFQIDTSELNKKTGVTMLAGDVIDLEGQMLYKVNGDTKVIYTVELSKVSDKKVKLNTSIKNGFKSPLNL